jgi:hypothetical protein
MNILASAISVVEHSVASHLKLALARGLNVWRN